MNVTFSRYFVFQRAGSCNLLFHLLSRQPALQEQRRRLVTKRRMQPTPVVKHLDVLEGRGRHLFMRAPAPAMHLLVLEAVEPTLGRRIVPAVTTARHRAGHAVFNELVLKVFAGVLAASVGVVQHTRRGLSPEPCHRQRVRRCQPHARFERPAHHLAVEQVEHDGQVQPAFVRPQVGVSDAHT